MGKKGFLDKKNATKFRLIPQSSAAPDIAPPPSTNFKPSKEHLEEQHKYGVFYDDNYDYTQHLRSRDEAVTMQNVAEEERVVVRAPAFPPPMPSMLFADANAAPVKKKVVFVDDDVDKALDGDFDFDDAEGTLDDNFISMAGGVIENERLVKTQFDFNEDEDDDDDDDDEDYDDDAYDDNYEGHGRHGMGGEVEGHEAAPQRDIDDAFDKMLDHDYNDDDFGELDPDDERIAGGLEPNDGRIKKLVGEKRANPEYDEQKAKEYVRARMRYLEEHGEEDEETEVVEIDPAASKRMKWDCESFATQYTNIYNHPTLIKEVGGKLSRKALKRLDKEAKKADMAEMEEEEEEDEDMEDDDASICTGVSTIRVKGETPEQRRLRKQAVKDAQKARRVEKKLNKLAFAEENRKLAARNVGRLKTTPIV